MTKHLFLLLELVDQALNAASVSEFCIRLKVRNSLLISHLFRIYFRYEELIKSNMPVRVVPVQVRSVVSIKCCE